MSKLIDITDTGYAARTALIQLNNAHAEETSLLSEERWDLLIQNAFLASVDSELRGFVIALDQSASYDSVNYQWFCSRFERFVYVDRIVVSAEHRCQGIARRLYSAVFAAARKAGHSRVCCEVNRVPPNPNSDAFHQNMGFAELATATLSDNGKTVRYLCHEL